MFPEEPLLRFNSPLTEQLQAPALDGGDLEEPLPAAEQGCPWFPTPVGGPREPREVPRRPVRIPPEGLRPPLPIGNKNTVSASLQP